MTLKLVFLILMCMLSYTTSHYTKAEMDLFKKLVAAICVPNFPADKAKQVADCDDVVPNNIKSIWRDCAKQAVGTPDLPYPVFCYRAFPGSEKLFSCVQKREEESAAQGIPLDHKEVEANQKAYFECLVKIL